MSVYIDAPNSYTAGVGTNGILTRRQEERHLLQQKSNTTKNGRVRGPRRIDKVSSANVRMKQELDQQKMLWRLLNIKNEIQYERHKTLELYNYPKSIFKPNNWRPTAL